MNEKLIVVFTIKKKEWRRSERHKVVNLRNKGKIQWVGPFPSSHKPICSRNFSYYINQQSYRHICYIFRVQVSGVGNLNSPAAALGQVYMVGSGAGGDDETQRREKAKHVAGDRTSAVTKQSSNRRRFTAMGNHKLLQRNRRTWIID